MASSHPATISRCILDTSSCSSSNSVYCALVQKANGGSSNSTSEIDFRRKPHAFALKWIKTTFPNINNAKENDLRDPPNNGQAFLEHLANINPTVTESTITTMYDAQYVYTKVRSEFGRQCAFSDDIPKKVDECKPDESLFSNYIYKDPLDRGTQVSTDYSEHEINTVRAEYEPRGMNHTEGGWPRDVNATDPEQIFRYRKKMEKDDMYINAVLHLTPAVEHCILQNNAIDIYEEYFGYETKITSEHLASKTVNVFRDPSTQKRPITHLSWSDDGTKVAVAHCILEFQRAPPDTSPNSYIWDIDNPNKPEFTITPNCSLVSIEYNPKDTHILVGGQYDGLVACWDMRRGSDPVEISPVAAAHRDPVYKVLWIASKTGTEFFSGSSDGVIKWWDMRKIEEPTDSLILDPSKGDQLMSRAMGATCLEYEPTIPTRFMTGTERGIVFSCNRKGKTPYEKLGYQFLAHLSPVYALSRNAGYVKNFLTVGDWTTRIWAEDTRESSIMWTRFHRTRLTDGLWSPTRFSTYFVTRTDGILDAWDILQQQDEPVLSIKLCDDPLRAIRAHDGGQLVAVGNEIGTTYLVEYSENMSTATRQEKTLLQAMFEREARREKILEGRAREIKLKKAKGAEKKEDEKSELDLVQVEELYKQAEREFFKSVQEDLRAKGLPPDSGPTLEEIEATEKAEKAAREAATKAPPPTKTEPDAATGEEEKKPD